MRKRVDSHKRPPFMLPNLLFFGLLRSPKNHRDWIHRGYTLYYLRRCRSFKRRLYILVLMVLSPLFILKDIFSWIRPLGREARALSGKSILRQSLEQFYLAFFYSFDSKTYYMQEFYLKEGLERAKDSVHKRALKYGVYRLLGDYGKYLSRDTSIISLGDKVEYTKFCERHSLPVVPIYREFLANGTIIHHHSKEGVGDLPEEDIFCKPKKDHEGEGAEAWYYKGDGIYRSPERESISKEDLREHLFKRAAQHRSGSYLVQPLILPHPELLPFREEATPTLRILTFQDIDGTVKVDRAMLRFSTDSTAVIDNASAGGLVAPIHGERGVLGIARDSRWDRLRAIYRRHPLHNTPIEGVAIPFFKEAIELVKEAKALFPHRLIIGWDVLITKEGPLLLEGNSQTGLCFLQRAHRTSLGKMKLGEMMAYYSKEAIETMYHGLLGSKKEDGEGQIHLYHRSSLKYWLSLFINHRVSISLHISGHLQDHGLKDWLKKAERRRVKVLHMKKREGEVEMTLKGRDIDVEDVVWSLWMVSQGRIERMEAKWS